jgi:vacuolar-type H+-ATPase subunit I/STV1
MSKYTIAIDNGQDIIDSRDVIARIEDLESERESLEAAVSNAKETLVDAKDETSVLANDTEAIAELEVAIVEATDDLEAWGTSEECEELTALKALADEGEFSSDWTYGVSLIRDSYFEEYAQQLAADLGAITSTDWPMNCIDWSRAADLLQQDYTSLDFDGEKYWIRS